MVWLSACEGKVSPLDHLVSFEDTLFKSVVLNFHSIDVEFSRPTALIRFLHGTEAPTVGENLTMNDDFSMSELQHAIIATRKRSAPSYDDVTKVSKHQSCQDFLTSW